ncbi:DNA-directed RNA polymerase subunit alpha [Nitrospina watsonii]|uniref:DNA-directed RNA polymerase subunit alpha n=1 Tax=Nitrospina watsonii TaxID=1323948 RepID=A0ABN8W039_9BACT|nr:DNA-directed RNA polymerase subunit alpha [Nitrospina watsonii]CAI2719414.1 RNA polymerase subunit alpha [Nitrospina watsonii]
MMQGIVKPKRLDFDKKTRSETYAKYQAGPFERGYGITVGNSLRRMLLSSIEGTAVTGVKFDGVFHEFSSIPGVMEDVTEIILNLKKLKLKLNGSEDSKRLYLKRNTAGEVLASDFQEDSDVTILSPDHKIATLDSNGNLDMEVLIQRGRGYVPADRHDMTTESVQMIPVDALFSPVEKVHYTVEKTRVGQSQDYDSLVMELWTDGSISPEDAVAHAAKIVKDHMQIFINFDEEPEPVQPQIDEKKQKLLTNLAKSVEELELSVRSYNCLKNANITTIAELVQKGDSEMLKTRNFGRKSLNEIKEILEEMGLSLGLKLEDEDIRQIQAMRKKKEVELEGERA